MLYSNIQSSLFQCTFWSCTEQRGASKNMPRGYAFCEFCPPHDMAHHHHCVFKSFQIGTRYLHCLLLPWSPLLLRKVAKDFLREKATPPQKKKLTAPPTPFSLSPPHVPPTLLPTLVYTLPNRKFSPVTISQHPQQYNTFCHEQKQKNRKKK